MNKKPTDAFYPSRHKKSSFWGIYFPLILTFLICIYIGALLFNLGSGNPLALDKWVNISLTAIAFLFFIPGIMLLFLFVSIILLVGKLNPLLKTGLFNSQLLIEKISGILLSLLKITLVPFSFQGILDRDLNKKNENFNKENIDE